MIKKSILSQILLVTIIFNLNSLGQNNKNDSIKSVKIGKQVWMSENLKSFYFADGKPIPIVKTNEEWKKASEEHTPACCYYENNSENGNAYGILYNLEAIRSGTVCPKGWHLPNIEEWNELINSIKSSDSVGFYLKGKSGWKEFDGDIVCNNCKDWEPAKKAGQVCSVCKDSRKIKGKISGGGNDFLGFNALPGGYRNDDGSFDGKASFGGWWTSDDGNNIYTMEMPRLYPAQFYYNLNYESVLLNRYEDVSGVGHSVRCIKDKSVSNNIKKK